MTTSIEGVSIVPGLSKTMVRRTLNKMGLPEHEMLREIEFSEHSRNIPGRSSEDLRIEKPWKKKKEDRPSGKK